MKEPCFTKPHGRNFVAARLRLEAWQQQRQSATVASQSRWRRYGVGGFRNKTFQKYCGKDVRQSFAPQACRKLFSRPLGAKMLKKVCSTCVKPYKWNSIEAERAMSPNWQKIGKSMFWRKWVDKWVDFATRHPNKQNRCLYDAFMSNRVVSFHVRFWLYSQRTSMRPLERRQSSPFAGLHAAWMYWPLRGCGDGQFSLYSRPFLTYAKC